MISFLNWRKLFSKSRRNQIYEDRTDFIYEMYRKMGRRK